MSFSSAAKHKFFPYWPLTTVRHSLLSKCVVAQYQFARRVFQRTTFSTRTIQTRDWSPMTSCEREEYAINPPITYYCRFPTGLFLASSTTFQSCHLPRSKLLFLFFNHKTFSPPSADGPSFATSHWSISRLHIRMSHSFQHPNWRPRPPIPKKKSGACYDPQSCTC